MNPVARFALKASLLASPLLVALGTYVATDPFCVLYPHVFGNYYDDFAPVELNRDYVSLRMFQRLDPERHFDSFIFGSSRSFPFHCDTWQRYVPGAKAFHYPAASENLLGIAEKLRYLDERGNRLAHVLVEMHMHTLEGVTPRTDVTHRMPYEVSGESWLDFQGAMLNSYFSDFYFVKYVDYKFSGRVRPYADRALGVRPGQVRIDPDTNDYFFEAFERELAAGEGAYYARRAPSFPAPSGTPPRCADAVIGPEQKAKLLAIRRIFDKHGTDYRIFVPPIYEGMCMNPADARELRSIFGERAIADFTGARGLTADAHNFYDATHVRPIVAERMLAAMYGGEGVSLNERP